MKLPVAFFQKVDASLEKSGTARKELRACSARIHAHGHRMIEDCLAIGKELFAAREITRGAWQGGTQEGEWRNFLAEDVKMPLRQARRFIYVYEKYARGGHVATPLPDTSFRVLAELAAPEGDPEVVAELEARIAKGERVTVRQVRAEKAAKQKPDNHAARITPAVNKKQMERTAIIIKPRATDPKTFKQDKDVMALSMLKQVWHQCSLSVKSEFLSYARSTLKSPIRGVGKRGIEIARTKQ